MAMKYLKHADADVLKMCVIVYFCRSLKFSDFSHHLKTIDAVYLVLPDFYIMIVT